MVEVHRHKIIWNISNDVNIFYQSKNIGAVRSSVLERFLFIKNYMPTWLINISCDMMCFGFWSYYYRQCLVLVKLIYILLLTLQLLWMTWRNFVIAQEWDSPVWSVSLFIATCHTQKILKMFLVPIILPQDNFINLYTVLKYFRDGSSSTGIYCNW